MRWDKEKRKCWGGTMYKQKNKILEAIIKTLAYADIFDYPMTAPEIHKYLIAKEKFSLQEIQDCLATYTTIQSQDGYFALGAIEKLVAVRRHRLTHSRRKLARAFFIANVLAVIPTIKLIGISGSLSMMNAGFHDDIDLFFVTRKNSLWTTRFFVTVMLYLLGQKRKRGVTYAANKICPNMFVASDSLGFLKNHQNLYIAHEVVQLKVLFDRGNTHGQFLSQNKWVSKFLPHIRRVHVPRTKQKMEFLTFPAKVIEKCFFTLQCIYMQKHKTIEDVTIRRAGFHPQDRKSGILELHALKCSYYLGNDRETKATVRRHLAVN